MAIFRYGPLASGISGSIQATTFAQGRTSPVARGRPLRTNPRTPRQITHRWCLAHAALEWRNLSTDRVNAWHTFSRTITLTNRLGIPFTPSGRNLFYWMNVPRFRAGLAFKADPPAFGFAQMPFGLYCTLDVSAGYTLNVSNILSGSVGPFHLFASRPFRTTPVSSPRTWAYIGNYLVTPPTETITTDFQAALGTLVAGEIVYFRARDMKTGFLPSHYFTFESTVVP